MGIFKDKNGYARWKNTGILVHRVVARNKVGGYIYPGYVVHHIDGDKMNFRKNNLWVMSRSSHSSLHARMRISNSYSNSIQQKTA